MDILLADLGRRHAAGLVSKDGECSCTVEDGMFDKCDNHYFDGGTRLHELPPRPPG